MPRKSAGTEEPCATRWRGTGSVDGAAHPPYVGVALSAAGQPGDLDQVGDDPLDAVDQRQVTLVEVDPGVTVRDVLDQPVAVGQRHHPIVGTLPDRDRHPDRRQVDAPRDDFGEVVVAPAAYALPA